MVYHHVKIQRSYREAIKRSTYLDFDLCEGFAVVDADDGADHLRQNRHVPQVGLNWIRLLRCDNLLLGVLKLL